MSKTIFEAAATDDVAALRSLLETNVAQSNRLAERTGRAELVLANSAWYSKKTLGWSSIVFGIIAIPALIVEAPLGAVIMFGIFSGSGVVIRDAGDGQLARSTCEREGWTPLHFAAACDAREAAKFLIQQNSNTTIKDKRNRIYLDIATQFGHEEFKNVCLAEINKLNEKDRIERNNSQQRINELTQQLFQARAERNEHARREEKLLDFADQLANENVQLQDENRQLAWALGGSLM